MAADVAVAPGLPIGTGRRADLRHPNLTMLAVTVGAALAVGAAIAVKPLAGILVLVAVAGALAISRRPDVSAYLLVIAAPSCAGLQRGLVVPGLRLSELAIVGLGALVLVLAPYGRRRWSGVEWALLGYAGLTAALGGFDLATRHASLSGEELGTLLGPFQFVILVRVVNVALRTPRQRRLAVHCILAAAVLVSLIALAQYADLGPTRSLLADATGGGGPYAKSLEEGVGRVTGPFNLWHELAGYLMPAVLLALALFLDGGPSRRRAGYGLAFAVTLLALVATATAGIAIATLAGVLYLAWKHRVLRFAAAVALPLVVVAALIFGSSLSTRAEQQYAPTSSSYSLPFLPQSLSYRYALFREQNAPALSGRWATGYGPDLPELLTLGNFPFAQSSYVLLLMRGGVILLAAFLLLALIVFEAARRARASAASRFEWSLASVVLIVTVAYVFLQLIESYLLDAGPPHAYWALVGLMLAALGSDAEGRTPVHPPYNARVHPGSLRRGGTPASES